MVRINRRDGSSGSSDKFQLYGEVGLRYGSPVEHGLIKDLS
jgi:hypothetical protein